MIAIDDTLVSEDVLEKKFVCDLKACKGICCVEGESGAPLEEEETAILEDIYEQVKPYMTEEGVSVVEKEGAFTIDIDNDFVTPLIGDAGACAYVNFDSNGVSKCAIEQAYEDGKVDFKKPISCHLYPVRIAKYEHYDGVNYHSWKVCDPACKLGAESNVKVFEFLKEPLIRKYGSAWYEKLQKADELKELEKGKGKS